ncbi:MAG: FUN14 domain-containing protein [Planctomycetota bacterium]|jgi:uncharacterized membrane protein (Fun14 family)
MSQPAEESRAPRWRAKLLIGLVVVIVAAILARQSFARDDAAKGEGSQLAATQTEEEEEPSGLEKILPYVTDAGSAMLLGFMLALATRGVLKLIFVALVLGFVALQFLAYKGILTVDLGEFAGWVGENVLNTSSDADAGQVAQEKVPTLGAGMLGYLLGLKKG